MPKNDAIRRINLRKYLNKAQAGPSVVVSSGAVSSSTVVSSDRKVAVSAGDAYPGFLNDKVEEGPGIDFSIQNAGDNETYKVEVDPAVLLSVTPWDFYLTDSSSDVSGYYKLASQDTEEDIN